MTAPGTREGITAEPAGRHRITAMPNAHSHAFQRGLRGKGERPGPGAGYAGEPAAPGGDGGDFWSWRAAMYRLAASLDPNSMHDEAMASFAEMVEAGYGAVGEFHYIHHAPDGSPYDDPAEMGIAVAEAAIAGGMFIVLLPAAYARAGWDSGDLEPQDAQRRFSDPDVDAFLERVERLREWADARPTVQVGVAAHSVRAVPASWLERIAAYAEQHGLVRHVHACEQKREVDECLAEHGCSPIALLDRTGFLGPRTSVIHGIHIGDEDVRLLAATQTVVVSCPTTEGNLGDGHFPALRYRDAGVRIAIGSDSQVRIDPFEEARELETGARRQGQTREGLLAAYGDLWDELVRNGAASLGLDTGTLPLVELDLSHPSLRGVAPEVLPLAIATCATADAVAGRVQGD
jgi:formimidoylglutamate deiminase